MIEIRAKAAMIVALLAVHSFFGASPALAQDASAVAPIALAEIKITVRDKVILGKLNDTPTSRDLLAQLSAAPWTMLSNRRRPDSLPR